MNLCIMILIISLPNSVADFSQTELNTYTKVYMCFISGQRK